MKGARSGRHPYLDLDEVVDERVAAFADAARVENADHCALVQQVVRVRDERVLGTEDARFVSKVC